MNKRQRAEWKKKKKRNKRSRLLVSNKWDLTVLYYPQCAVLLSCALWGASSQPNDPPTPAELVTLHTLSVFSMKRVSGTSEQIFEDTEHWTPGSGLPWQQTVGNTCASVPNTLHLNRSPASDIRQQGKTKDAPSKEEIIIMELAIQFHLKNYLSYKLVSKVLYQIK